MFRLGDVAVAPGKKAKGSLGALEVATARYPVPLLVVRGSGDGPTAVIIAAVHGFETCTVAVAHRVAARLDPALLRGTVVVVPCANPVAAARGDYTAWPDGENLSGIWPRASAQGSFSERLAALIFPALERADIIVDLHANPLPAIPFMLVARDADAETMRLARSFGLTTIKQDRPTNYSRGLRQIMQERGVPMFNPELAGSPYYSDDLADLGQKGLCNVFRAAAMLAGDPEPLPGVKVLDGDFEVVGRLRVQRGGFVRPLYPPGVKIQGGKTVLEVVDVWGEVVDRVAMPVTGYCWSYSTGYLHNYAFVVSEGTRVGYVFRDLSDPL